MNPRHAPTAMPDAAAEVLARPERLARWLIKQAARTSPPSLSERLQEEWLADLAVQRRGLSRLRFAIGCCWATQVIVHDHVAMRGAAASSATQRGSMATLAQHDPSRFSRRTTVFFLIVCVHALMIYGLANGLVRKVAEAIGPPTVTYIVNEPRPRETASRLPEPNLWHPPVSLPVPDPVDFPADTATADDTVISPPQNASSPPLPANVHRLLGGPGLGFPDTDAYYPYASRRQGETGVATVRVCVDGEGRLGSDPTIAQSSGSARLDEGALKLAKAGSGHYRSTTEAGKPVSYCYPFRIRFELKK